MRNILKFLRVIQTDSNGERHRLNPYNPLSYIVIISIPIIGILMFGFVGFWKEVDFSNPFKWN